MDLAESDYGALFYINTKGCWLAAKAAYPLLKRAATQDAPARVVFVASAAALRPKTGGGAYAASKVALTYLTRVLAVELASQSILRSEEHTSELQSLMRISYAVFCLKKKTKQSQSTPISTT